MEVKKFIDPSTLDAVCDEREQMLVTRTFTKEEISALKSRLANVVIEIDHRNKLSSQFKMLLSQSMELEELVSSCQELFDDVSDLSEKGVKELSKEKENIKSQIKNGFVEREEMVYKFKDHEEGIVAFYDLEGNLFSSRNMYPNERQAKLFNIKQA